MRLAAAIAGLMMAFAGTAQAAPLTSSGTAIAIMKASAALQANDCAAAMSPLNQLWNDPYLEGQDPDLSAQYRLRLIACTADTVGLKDALNLSANNITRASANVTAYDMHAFLELYAKRPDLAADTLEAAMTRFPDTAKDIGDLTMLGTLIPLHDVPGGRWLTLLDHAEQVGWQSHQLAAAPAMGMMRLEGLRAAVAARRDDLIALYRADLKQDAFSYITSQGDGLVSAADAAPEPVAPILAAQIAAAKKAVVASPTDLMTLSWLMTLERSAGQHGVALTQLDGILALIDQYGLKQFQNPELYGELLADRALLVSALGRQVEARDTFKFAATKVSAATGAGDFYVAYAGFLVANGDEAGAIALIDNMDIAGFTDAQKVRLVAHDACAYARSGRASDYATYLSVVGDAVMRVEPKLCAGDTEGAAADLLAVINEPVLRNDAILLLQNRIDLPAASDKQEALQQAMSALKTRPDVTEAATAAGIIVRSWPIAF